MKTFRKSFIKKKPLRKASAKETFRESLIKAQSAIHSKNKANAEALYNFLVLKNKKQGISYQKAVKLVEVMCL